MENNAIVIRFVISDPEKTDEITKLVRTEVEALREKYDGKLDGLAKISMAKNSHEHLA
jgi:hypothetical protein|tara:strand:+ start:17466 stop:17639 length:174 start_codon:yes stop_codon:yes gene_type:complete